MMALRISKSKTNDNAPTPHYIEEGAAAELLAMVLVGGETPTTQFYTIHIN